MGQLRKTTIDGQTVMVGPDVGDGAEVARAHVEVQRAFTAIVDTLRTERIHPVDAGNALLNVWHAILVAIAPEQIIPALDAMREFHAAWVVQNADA